MPIDFDYFLDWAIRRFGEDGVVRRGDEVCINSPFVPAHDPDRGHHLYCNPDKGVYHCWKSEASGTLYQLVCDTEGCIYPEAVDILGGRNDLHDLEKKIKEFFANKSKEKPVGKPNKLELPSDTFIITSLRPENRLRRLSEVYLRGRGLPIDDLYVCASGRYADRIVIPYWGPEGNLIYFNSRAVTNRVRLRYLGPPKEVGVGKAEVVWMKSWPADGSKIYLTEGEFDAMSLCMAGFHGGALGGKNFSEGQFDLLKNYNLVVCFDLDRAGLEARNKMLMYLRRHQFVRGRRNDYIGYVKPANGYKDWNEMLVKFGPSVVHHYVNESERAIDHWGKLSNLR